MLKMIGAKINNSFNSTRIESHTGNILIRFRFTDHSWQRTAPILPPDVKVMNKNQSSLELTNETDRPLHVGGRNRILVREC